MTVTVQPGRCPDPMACAQRSSGCAGWCFHSDATKGNDAAEHAQMTDTQRLDWLLRHTSGSGCGDWLACCPVRLTSTNFALLSTRMVAVELTATWEKIVLSERGEEELRLGGLYLGSVQQAGVGEGWLYYRKGDPSPRTCLSRDDAKAALVRISGGRQ